MGYSLTPQYAEQLRQEQLEQENCPFCNPGVYIQSFKVLKAPVNIEGLIKLLGLGLENPGDLEDLGEGE